MYKSKIGSSVVLNPISVTANCGISCNDSCKDGCGAMCSITCTSCALGCSYECMDGSGLNALPEQNV